MRFQTWSLLSLVALLAACGGGGGSSTPAGGSTGGGTPPPVGTVRLVSATAEKGPFVIGSSVTVNQLNDQAQPTASTLTTETDDNLGNFSFSIEPGPVSISVDGFHFNEITGSLANGRLTLRAIYEVQDTETQRAHVNLLTHLIHLRVETLVQAGSSIASAVQTAQTELTAQLSPIFGPFSPDNFVNYSVYASDSTSSDGAAYILAASAAIYQFAINRGGTGGFDAELALIVNNLSDDFADGAIDLQWIFDGIDSGSVQVDPAQLSSNLLNHAASVGFTAEPADASLFIDTDRDGIMNAIDDDDDNDGVLDLDDPFPLDPSESSDFDNDGIGDNADSDDDNDGTQDANDAFPFDPTEDTDTDGDGIGNNADPDDDNDGIPDDEDPSPQSSPPVILGELDQPIVRNVYYSHFLEIEYRGNDPCSLNLMIEGLSELSGVLLRAEEVSLFERVPPTDNCILWILMPHGTTRPVGTYPVEIIVADGLNEARYQTEIVIVEPDSVPVLTKHSATVAFRGRSFASQLAATDPRGTGLTWSIDHSDSDWISIDPATGQLSGSVPVDYKRPAEPLDKATTDACLLRQNVELDSICATDVINVGISDGVVKTNWPLFIDVLDSNEIASPFSDGNPWHIDRPTSVHVDSSDSIVIGGTTGRSIDGNSGAGGDDVFLKKLGPQMDEKWTLILGSNGQDRLISSQINSDDDVFLLIYSDGDWTGLLGVGSSPTGNKRLVAKVNSDGQVEWGIEIPDPTPFALPDLEIDYQAPNLVSLPSGGVRYISFSAQDSPNEPGQFLDIDTNGQLSVSSEFQPLGFRIAVHASSDGISNFVAGSDHIAKIGADGTMAWSKEFDPNRGSAEGRFATSIITDLSGNVIAAGIWGTATEEDPRGWFLAKYDPDGNLIWFNPYVSDDPNLYGQGNVEIISSGLSIDTENNICVGGDMWLQTFDSQSTGGKFQTVVKISPDGTVLWYDGMWRAEGGGLAIATSSADSVFATSLGGANGDISYPGQFECTESDPCDRTIRDAVNAWAFIADGPGGADFTVNAYDASGNELTTVQ